MFLVYLAVGVGVLIVVWGIMNAAANAPPRKLATGIKVGAGVGGGLLAIWLLFTGWLGPALSLLSIFAPLQTWARRARTMARNAGGPAQGQSSGVETAYLRMSLDHDTGGIDGTVLRGRFAGRQLGELPALALLDLLAELRLADGEGATILEAYLDRVHPDWRGEGASRPSQDAAPGSGSPSAAMTRDEAYRVLGLEPGAGEREIRDAHRRLMVKMHPDQGGSTYLAAKINQAKDLLLRH
jgi:hypothetical protein